MKKDKKLLQLVNKLVKLSVDITGEVTEQKVKKYCSVLGSLPRQYAIYSLSEYLKRLRGLIERTKLTIETPMSLTAVQTSKVKDSFAALSKIREVEVKINPSLFGGMRVKIGDMIYDDTIENKIVQIREGIVQA